MCNLILALLIFVLGLSSLEVLAQPFHTLVTSLHKDPNTSLHTVTLTLNPSEQYLVDLDAPFIWNRCDFPQPMVSFDDPECSTARNYISPLCPEANNTYGYSCYITPVNPITGSCAPSYLSGNVLTVYWTAGRSLSTYRIQYFNRYVSCAPSSLLQSLPAQAIGVASLSWSTLSLLYQFTPFFLDVAKKFSICLSSSSDDQGVIFFGDGPYYIEPPANFDASSVLSYTPLIKNPTTLGYFINVTGISIDQQAISVPANAFALDFNGGVKLSTTVPYTTLRRDIYSVFISEFKKALKGIPRGKRMSPLDFCFKTNITQEKKDESIPQIDLVLGDGGHWTIHESNLLKQVNDDVACLAFVDGGDSAEHAVVIGTYQMENIMLQFDLVQSRLGFSSSLSSFGSSCGNFDFTVRP
ncbi:gamma conglutin 1-like [Rhodamnia argentea]|uniref:Gamma conglutin 1-like n=1 Tax=Rhodamnia argentea TaxID=178133 RepID=A0A8B8PPF2_9MYRT|nr:gamma conglutin 1-like [Rhodamnia argentea]